MHLIYLFQFSSLELVELTSKKWRCFGAQCSVFFPFPLKCSFFYGKPHPQLRGVARLVFPCLRKEYINFPGWRSKQIRTLSWRRNSNHFAFVKNNYLLLNFTDAGIRCWQRWEAWEHNWTGSHKGYCAVCSDARRARYVTFVPVNLSFVDFLFTLLQPIVHSFSILWYDLVYTAIF